LNKITESVKRKKDFVTVLALALFVIIVIFELVLVIWLPAKFRSGEYFAKEVALEEMVQNEDTLRAFVSDVHRKEYYYPREVKLVKKCLDDFARYLRVYKDEMTMEQILDLHEDIKEFDRIFYKWKSRIEFFKKKELDYSGYMAFLQKKCGIKPPAKPEKTPETKPASTAKGSANETE
jgi:hypothetical protein